MYSVLMYDYIINILPPSFVEIYLKNDKIVMLFQPRHPCVSAFKLHANVANEPKCPGFTENNEWP